MRGTKPEILKTAGGDMLKVGITFEVPYSNIIGTKRVDVEINGKEPTVGEVIENFLEQYPGLKEKLQKKNLLHGDSLNALYLTENEIVSQDKVLCENAEIRVLIPMAGG
jgi:molybdopterin converting factor small subunit